MKKTVSVILAVVMVFMLFSLAGCSKYLSKYSAVGFVHSNTSDSASMSFMSFNGTMVFELTFKEGEKYDIHSTAELESGNLTVYYDSTGEKYEYYSLEGGATISENLSYFDEGKVYIIVQTDGECKNGSLTFELQEMEE